jgi:hypothetical protein
VPFNCQSEQFLLMDGLRREGRKHLAPFTGVNEGVFLEIGD